MSTDEQRPPAWQPLTPRGVAAFAQARLGRLWLVQLLFALIAATAICWTIQTGWFRVIAAAIDQLPAQGEIRRGILEWHGDSSQTLAENRFLAITIDLKHAGQARSPAHVQFEFGDSSVKIISLLGYLELFYPQGWIFAFNRPELWPWWGAWSPALLALLFGAAVAGLLVVWAVLASLYCWVAWLWAFFANRQLTLRQSWRVCGAALMPGALVMTVGIVLYGLGVIDPIRLIGVAALHFVVGWAFVCVSPFCLPRHPEAPAPTRSNPFNRGKKGEDTTQPAR